MSKSLRTPPTFDLSMLLNQAGHAVTSRVARALADVGISVKVYCVLKKAVEGDFTQAQLAELAWMDKTTVVHVLDEMERGGLAARTMSPADRRVRLVAVTAKGRDLLLQADELVQATYDDIVGTLAVSQRAAFLSALTALVEGPLATPFHMDEQVAGTRRARR